MEIDRFAGRAVQLEGWIRGENVSTGSKAIFGPKLMLAITDKNQTVWLDQPKLYGTFPWTKFQVFARIPAEPKQIKLVLGLENVTGTVFFSRVKIVEVPQVAPPKSDAGKAALQQTPAYRGTMSKVPPPAIRSTPIPTSEARKSFRALFTASDAFGSLSTVGSA